MTALPSAPSREQLEGWLAGVPLVVVSVVLLSTAADILPGNSLVGIGEVQLNLARILILLGLIAAVATRGLGGGLFRTGVGLPLLLLLAVGLLSSHKYGTYPRYRFLVEGVALFYLTFAVIRARAESRDALATIGLVALGVVALTAVSQVAQGQLTGFYRQGCTPVTMTGGRPPSGSLTRAIGTFSNPNVLAGYLMLLIPLGALGARSLGRVRTAWPALVATLALGYLAVMFTYSRAAVLLSLALVGLAIALSQLTGRRYLIVLALGLAIGLSFLVSTCGSNVTAGYGRAQEWSETLSVIRHNPIYGVGLGRLGSVLHARNALSTAQHAHNLFLTWWAEAGTGALIAWIWLALVLLWRSFRAARAGEPAAVFALIALLGFFGYSMTDHPANVDQVALAFWVVAGVAAATTVRPRRARAPWKGRFPGVALGASDAGEQEVVPSAAAQARTGNVRVYDGPAERSSPRVESPPSPQPQAVDEASPERPPAAPPSNGSASARERSQREGRFDYEDQPLPQRIEDPSRFDF